MSNMRIKEHAKKWTKGQSGNPKGSSALQRMRGDIRRMTQEQVAEVGSMLVNGKFADLTKITKDKEATLLEVWTATLILRSMAKCDSAVYERILNRIIGKVPDKFEVTGRDGSPIELKSIGELKEELEAIQKAKIEMGED